MEPLLSGKKVLVTRAANQSVSLCRRIEAYGGEPIAIPLMEYQRTALLPAEMSEWRLNVTRSDWIVITSQNSLRFFIDTIQDLGQIEGIKFAVVGKKTEQALKGYGIHADFIPENFRVRALLDAFRSGMIEAKRVTVPLGSRSHSEWLNELRKQGIRVNSKVLYQTLPNRSAQPKLASAISSGLAAITFASPSAVHFFTELLDKRLWQQALSNCVLAAIGSTTASALEKLERAPDIVPKQFTASAMIDALADYYKRRKS